MGKQYKPSKPFPNGTAYGIFNDAFCCRCKKYKLNDDGLPTADNCAVENAIAEAQFDCDKFPTDDIVEVGDYMHVCLRFESDDSEVTEMYKGLFDEGSGDE